MLRGFGHLKLKIQKAHTQIALIIWPRDNWNGQ